MIGIITVYKSNNCGSFWQAFCLQEAIKNMDAQCGMIEYRPQFRLSPSYYEIKHIAASILKGKPKTTVNLILKWRHFHYDRKILMPTILKKGSAYDYIIIGSDTLWNVKDYYFDAMIAYYTGNEISSKDFSVFGTSAGSATIKDLEKYKKEFQGLLNSKYIYVRDESTSTAVQSLIGIKPETVCDPTLLFDNEYYYSLIKRRKSHNEDKEKYILLYMFGDIEEDVANEIIMFSKEHEYRMISIEKMFAWADEIIAAGPMDFLEYFSKAEYIFTDTFHGTVFSTIFEKQFIVLNDKKPKIIDYLKSINLTNRIATDVSSIEKTISQRIRYSIVSDNIKSIRLESLKKLRNVVSI